MGPWLSQKAQVSLCHLLQMDHKAISNMSGAALPCYQVHMGKILTPSQILTTVFTHFQLNKEATCVWVGSSASAHHLLGWSLYRAGDLDSLCRTDAVLCSPLLSWMLVCFAAYQKLEIKYGDQSEMKKSMARLEINFRGSKKLHTWWGLTIIHSSRETLSEVELKGGTAERSLHS